MYTQCPKGGYNTYARLDNVVVYCRYLVRCAVSATYGVSYLGTQVYRHLGMQCLFFTLISEELKLVG